MRPIFNLRIALAVFALVAVPAVAPPQQASAAEIYDAAHAQILTVDKSAKTVNLTPTKYSATPGFQTLADGGTNYDWAKLVLLAGGWPMSQKQRHGHAALDAPGERRERLVEPRQPAEQQLRRARRGWHGSLRQPDHRRAEGGRRAARRRRRRLRGNRERARAHPNRRSVTAEAIWASSWSTSHYANGTHWSTAPVPVVKAPAERLVARFGNRES